MEQPEAYAYLDHNVLDLVTKGDPYKVKELLKEVKLTPVYSDETLKEIHRSRGYEEKFLELLEEINAKFIKPVLDNNFKQTGDAKIHVISPKVAYEQFLSNKSESPEGNFGLSEMMMKFYGGKQNFSFEEIFEEGANELQAYLSQAVESLKNISGFSSREIEYLKNCISILPEVMKDQTSKIAAELDQRDETPISKFEVETGIGPKLLKNIQPPNVVLQIWEVISKKMDLKNMELDTFFGIKPISFDEDSDRGRTLQEKVNAIYHQLNFLGYYRDSNMKKENRFIASFSDMTHAGIASFCHVFLCGDEDLVMKSAAAFEYLEIKTKILHYKANKSIQMIGWD